MSAPVIENPPAPEVIGEIGLEPISFSELSGATPAPSPTPAPAPEPTPAPAAPDKPDAKGGLDGLFGEPATPPPVEEGQDPPAEDKGLPAALRAQIAQTKKEKLELEQQLEAITEASRKEYDDLKAEFESYRRDTAITDPTQAPEVVQAATSFENTVAKVSKTLPPNVARTFLKNAKSLVDQFSQLGDLHDPDYDKRYEDLQNRMKQNFGHHADEVMKSMPSLDEMASRVKDAVRMATEVSGDVQRTRSLKTHQQSAQTFDAAVRETLSYNEELAAADPFSARNVVASFLAQSPEFQERSQKLLGYLRQGLVLPGPLSADAVKGLTQDQIREAESNIHGSFAGASSEIYQNTALAYHSMLALPGVTKMLKEYKDKYEALIASSPSEGPGAGRVDNPPPASKKDEAPDGFRAITMDEIMRNP